MIKYSFVLPAYKARFFREAIDSILAQTYTDFELIIVNDASPEDLDAIVRSYDDPRIRYYVNEQNIGGRELVVQWNHCLEYANGEYIILASDDDVYFPQYLEEMDALVEKYPEVNVFRSRVQRIDADGNVIDIESYLPEYSTMLEFSYAWMRGYVKRGIPFFVFKRTELQSIGGFVNFPLAWYSDDATVLTLADKGIVASSKILFSFRQSGENISSKSNDSSTLKRKLDATDMFYKWYERYLMEIKTINIYESFYKSKIVASLRERWKTESVIWVCESHPTAILKNSRRLLVGKIVSLRFLVLTILRKL